MPRKAKRTYTKAEKDLLCLEWQASGEFLGSWTAARGITASAFRTWVVGRGMDPVRQKGATSSKGKSGHGNTHNDAKVRAVLLDAYGPHRVGVGAAAEKHGVSKASISIWKTQRSHLMPGGTEVVQPTLQLGPGPALPPDPTRLEDFAQPDAQQELFARSQEDAYDELQRLLQPLPVQARLRVLQLVGELGS